MQLYVRRSNCLSREHRCKHSLVARQKTHRIIAHGQLAAPPICALNHCRQLELPWLQQVRPRALQQQKLGVRACTPMVVGLHHAVNIQVMAGSHSNQSQLSTGAHAPGSLTTDLDGCVSVRQHTSPAAWCSPALAAAAHLGTL